MNKYIRLMIFVRCDVSFSRSWRCSCRSRSTITRQLVSELPHSCCSMLLHQNWIVTHLNEIWFGLVSTSIYMPKVFQFEPVFKKTYANKECNLGNRRLATGISLSPSLSA